MRHRLIATKTLLLVLILSVAAGCAVPRGQEFAEYQAKMKDRGFLRTDPAPPDVPYTNADLADHFQRIAFFTYPDDRDRIPKPITRWDRTITYALVGQRQDQPLVDAFMERMSRLTGLSALPVPAKDANFLILIVRPRQQKTVLRALTKTSARSAARSLFRSIHDCGAVVGWSQSEPSITAAMVFLHGDLKGLYRELCFHEEIAQSLGLFNDDPTVRPSIFNDDDEFALLTTHDELLLRILYDQRLRPGMMPVEAMPIVRRIIEELRPGL